MLQKVGAKCTNTKVVFPHGKCLYHGVCMVHIITSGNSFTCVWLCELCLCQLAWVRLTAFDFKKSGLVILAFYCSYINNINLFKVSEFYVLSVFLSYSVG